jgi:hypothetical protein
MLRQARQLRSKLMGQNGSRLALIHIRSDNLALAAHWSLTSRDLTLPASWAWQSATHAAQYSCKQSHEIIPLPFRGGESAELYKQGRVRVPIRDVAGVHVSERKSAKWGGPPVLSPMLALAKGWGPFSIQNTFSGSLPTSGTNAVGRSFLWNTAFEYNIKGKIWPMIEQNSKFFCGRARLGKEADVPGAWGCFWHVSSRGATRFL